MPAGTYHQLAKRDTPRDQTTTRTYRMSVRTADSLAGLAADLAVSVSDLADYVLNQGLAAIADGRIAVPTTTPATVRRIVRNG